MALGLDFQCTQELQRIFSAPSNYMSSSFVWFLRLPDGTFFLLQLHCRISNGALLSDMADIIKIVLRDSQIHDFASCSAICESYISKESTEQKYTWFQVLAGSFQDFKKVVLPLRLSPRMVSRKWFSDSTFTANIGHKR